jgi:hypothetical protein
MKKILLLSMLLFNIMAFSQSKEVNKVIDNTSSAIKKVYSDGSKIVNKAYDASVVVAPKIESALKSLGTELKVGADKVWTILIRQQLVWSICILILVLLTIFSWFHFWYRINEWHRNNEAGGYISACIITCIIAIAGTITSSLHFEAMLTGFINPEFGAMKTIATIASQIK